MNTGIGTGTGIDTNINIIAMINMIISICINFSIEFIIIDIVFVIIMIMHVPYFTSLMSDWSLPSDLRPDIPSTTFFCGFLKCSITPIALTTSEDVSKILL